MFEVYDAGVILGILDHHTGNYCSSHGICVGVEHSAHLHEARDLLDKLTDRPILEDSGPKVPAMWALGPETLHVGPGLWNLSVLSQS